MVITFTKTKNYSQFIKLNFTKFKNLYLLQLNPSQSLIL